MDRTGIEFPPKHAALRDDVHMLGALVGEVLRDQGGAFSPEVREALKLELGDVLWYVAQLASELQFELNEIAAANLAKLASRAERNVIGGSGDHR